ncbi:MAG TPA: tripartite tricarboxylate transporter substrate-binding protein [Bordetella sp.]|uniref:Bug family tripartite tricarboxylate transporter substrate binding protein n=1 Tax=Bordetella sp. TaxID=28081 RepID=UPI002ED1476A
MLRRFLSLALLTLGMLCATASAEEPPLRLVVGFAAGGGVDILARLLAKQLSGPLGRAVIVENRPGAGGTIAADYVSRAEHDGNTLLFGDTSLMIAPFIYPHLNYDWHKLTPVGMVGQAVLTVSVPGDSPFHTLPELLQAARQAPNRYSYASVGVGSIHHLAGELLKREAHVSLVHVPYRGAAPATQDLVSGQIPVAIASLPSVLPQLQAGHVRILAVMTAKRFPTVPDIPTVAETLPGFEATPALFLLAPAGTPAKALKALETALPTVLNTPELQHQYLEQGSQVRYMPAGKLADWMKAQQAHWGGLIHDAHLTFNNP